MENSAPVCLKFSKIQYNIVKVYNYKPFFCAGTFSYIAQPAGTRSSLVFINAIYVETTLLNEKYNWLLLIVAPNNTDFESDLSLLSDFVTMNKCGCNFSQN